MPDLMLHTRPASSRLSPLISQAGKGAGGEPDGGRGEAEPRAEDEG